MGSVNRARLDESGSDQIVANACHVCKYLYSGYETEASNICKTCNKRLCATCTENHESSSETRDHKLVSLSSLTVPEKTDIKVSCVCGRNLEATFYCEIHRDVLCRACKNFEHVGCDVTDVNERSVSGMKNKFGLMLTNIESLKMRTDNFIKERKLEERVLFEDKENCKEEVKAFNKELKHLIDKLEDDAIANLEETVSGHKEILRNHMSTCMTSLEILRSQNSLLNKVIKTNDKHTQFAAGVIISNRLYELESNLGTVFNAAKSPRITFNRSTSLIEKLTKTKMGSMLEKPSDAQTGFVTGFARDSFVEYGKQELRPKSFLNLRSEMPNYLDIRSPKQGSVYVPDITGCAFTPEGKVLLCDYKNGTVTLLDSLFSFEECLKLDSQPFDVSVIDRNTAVVTCPSSKRLQYITLTTKLRTGRVIQLNKSCWGVDVANNHIFITCHSNLLVRSKDGEIRQLNIEGKVILNWCGPYMFSWPFYITVNPTSGKIFVSDSWNGKITCLRSLKPSVTPQGQRWALISNYVYDIVYEYSGQGLNCIKGLCVDDKDNIIVCGKKSDNVNVINFRGQHHDSLLTNLNGLKSPQAIAYRQSSGTLVVGCGDSNYLYTKHFDI